MGDDVDDAVEVLRKYGVGGLTVKRLQRSGLLDLELLALMNPEELIELTDIKDPAAASRVVRAARRAIGRSVEVLVGRDILKRELDRERFTSGINSMDELLGGGLAVYDIYEFAGEFGSGKTQLCHQLAVTVQLPEERGGLGGGVVYIDTEGTFNPGRIESIAERFGVEEPLERVVLARPFTVDELEDFIRQSLLETVRRRNIRLIVIDSVIALYRAQFRGREWLARRQQRINYMLDWLKRVLRVTRSVGVITNQILSSPTSFGVTMKLPAGGNIIAHASTHRFLLRKSGDKHILEVLDSPRLPRKAAIQFVIKEDGLHDA